MTTLKLVAYNSAEAATPYTVSFLGIIKNLQNRIANALKLFVK